MNKNVPLKTNLREMKCKEYPEYIKALGSGQDLRGNTRFVTSRQNISQARNIKGTASTSGHRCCRESYRGFGERK